MKRRLTLSALLLVFCLFSGVLQSRAQSPDPPKFELAAEFTSITKPSYDNGATEPGFGGRITYNVKKSVAVEAVGYFFPHKCRFGFCVSDNQGNATEALVGVKVGKRFEKWGIFAKARPGLMSFSQGNSGYIVTGSGPFAITFQHDRATHPAFDLGGVLEFYPTKRLITRFDAGDTLIHYSRRTENFIFYDITGTPTLFPFTRPAETRHNFQFAASVGFRF
jgi:hypothetical protein